MTTQTTWELSRDSIDGASLTFENGKALKVYLGEKEFAMIYGENKESNACLIAAAPDILQDLENLFSLIENDSEDVCLALGLTKKALDLHLDSARKSISKARGETI